jgi:hypothetical protein
MCKKLKLDIIKAMLIIANANSSKVKHQRREKRYYWCLECKTYHTTSK